MLLFTDSRGVDGAIWSDGHGGDFALSGFVEHKTFGGGGILFFAIFIFGTRDAQDATAGFGAGEKILAGIESQDADVCLVAGIEKFVFTVGGDSEDLSFIPGSDKERAIRGKSEIPNIFGLRIEEDRFFARGGEISFNALSADSLTRRVLSFVFTVSAGMAA